MKHILQMVLFFFIVIFVSCKKENTNQPPVASAGPDQMLIFPVDSTELHGVGIDPEKRIASYAWKKISGPVQYTVKYATVAITQVKNLAAGVYIFELTVTDDQGSWARDSVVVTVLDGPLPPCIDCWDY